MSSRRSQETIGSVRSPPHGSVRMRHWNGSGPRSPRPPRRRRKPFGGYWRGLGGVGKCHPGFSGYFATVALGFIWFSGRIRGFAGRREFVVETHWRWGRSMGISGSTRTPSINSSGRSKDSGLAQLSVTNQTKTRFCGLRRAPAVTVICWKNWMSSTRLEACRPNLIGVTPEGVLVVKQVLGERLREGTDTSELLPPTLIPWPSRFLRCDRDHARLAFVRGRAHGWWLILMIAMWCALRTARCASSILWRLR